MSFKKIITLLFIIFFTVGNFAQEVGDTLTEKKSRFNYKPYIVPTVLIAYGLIGMENHQILNINDQIRNEITEDIDHKTSIDDFSRYAPVVAVYGLNAIGISGKHNLKDRTIIIATSYLLMGSTVLGLKSVTHIERPDGSSNNSFPSGHTATAFAGAEFLWQEYKDQSTWYGIAGYAVATGTGLFRMYNNRHWLTDVAAGAGIGILSTKVAYLIAPYLTDKVFSSKEKKVSSTMMPFYNGNQMGCGFLVQF